MEQQLVMAYSLIEEICEAMSPEAGFSFAEFLLAVQARDSILAFANSQHITLGDHVCEECATEVAETAEAIANGLEEG